MHISNTTQLSGIIFDLDGTLVESQLDFPLLRATIGCPDNQDLLTYIDTLEQTAQAKAHALIEQHELDDAQQATWLPGAQSLVDAIAQLGLPMAIITRNSAKAANLKVHNNQIPIDLVLTRADAPPKPNPAALLHVARHWQISAQNIMYVGDYKYDLEAANRAGMQACLYAPEQTPDYAYLAQTVVNSHDILSRYIHKVVTNSPQNNPNPLT